MRDLINNKEIIINKADKGSTIVIHNKGDYIGQGLKHLNKLNVHIR